MVAKQIKPVALHSWGKVDGDAQSSYIMRRIVFSVAVMNEMKIVEELHKEGVVSAVSS